MSTQVERQKVLSAAREGDAEAKNALVNWLFKDLISAVRQMRDPRNPGHTQPTEMESVLMSELRSFLERSNRQLPTNVTTSKRLISYFKKCVEHRCIDRLRKVSSQKWAGGVRDLGDQDIATSQHTKERRIVSGGPEYIQQTNEMRGKVGDADDPVVHLREAYDWVREHRLSDRTRLLLQLILEGYEQSPRGYTQKKLAELLGLKHSQVGQVRRLKKRMMDELRSAFPNMPRL